MTVTCRQLPSDAVGTLFVVGLPIGNHDDLSPRVRRTISQADVVLAEDTRRFRVFARNAGIPYRRVERFDANVELDRLDPALEMLRAGLRLALVTDAGTPLISDPGNALVRAASKAGITVRQVPGPSALLAAAMCAGLGQGPLLFLGFLPRRSSRRMSVLRQAGQLGANIVMFESPKRLAATLADLSNALPDRGLVIARELTKIHEEVIRTTTSSAVEDMDGHDPRGEYTLVIGPSEGGDGFDAEQSSGIEPHGEVLRLIAELRGTIPAKDLAAALSRSTGLSRRAAYDLVLSARPAHHVP